MSCDIDFAVKIMATETPLSTPMDVNISERDSKTQSKPEPLCTSALLNVPNASQGQLLLMNPPSGVVGTTQSLISLVLKTTPTNNTPQLVLQATPTLQQNATPTAPKPKLTREEREAQRLDRERVKAEIIAKREEERLKKEQEKAKKEQERAKKEAEKKERQERKAREEQERREKRERKDAEKKKREEERKKAELEREQAKEEKLRKEQQKKERFMGFFSRQPKVDSAKKAVKPVYSFITPFSVQTDMTLAPRPCPPLVSTEMFDQLLAAQDSVISLNDSLKQLKKNVPKVDARAKQPEKDIIEVKPGENKVQHQFKLLQFHQNYRPAYFGTWRKTSRHVNPRNPFRKDEDQMDYSVDSDDEWEEEEPGESISDSEGEDSCEEGEEDEEDDGFFVPHGYLSEEEGGDDVSAGFDPTGSSDDNEFKRKKMAAKEKAWEAEFARKCQPLKPVCVGCTWTRMSCDGGDNLSKDVGFLEQFAAVALVDLPLSVEAKKETKEPIENLGGSAELTRMPVPEEAVPDLIRLIHGSPIGVSRIIKTFRIHWGAKKVAPPTSVQTTPTNSSPKTPTARMPQDSSILENASKISKCQLKKKIHEIAIKESRSPSYKPVWYVHDSILKKYNISLDSMTPLSLPLMTSEPVTPTTPHSTISDKKRPQQGTRTLVDMFKKSPSPKRVKLELHIDKLPLTLTNNSSPPPIQKLKTHSTSPQGKNVPLQVTTPTTPHLAADKKPIPQGTKTLFDMLKKPTPPPRRIALQLHVDKPPLTSKPENVDPPSPQKRDLEDPTLPQSAAKRLCLEDATNSMEGNKTLIYTNNNFSQPLAN